MSDSVQYFIRFYALRPDDGNDSKWKKTTRVVCMALEKSQFVTKRIPNTE